MKTSLPILLPALALTALAWTASPAVSAAEPSGYYDSCLGKSGATLLRGLEAVVGDHDALSYKGLWTAYETTDTDASGRVIDMYSSKLWTYEDEQCGSYKNVGDCYNREHSFPKSWFSDATPMYTDLFHIYPTDGKVNGQRSNYPFGVCANGTRLSNGSIVARGKLGTSTYPGYTGTVFEPDDEFKGDFARSYFYMAAAYNSRVSSWSSDQLAGNAYPAFSSWSVTMLMEWHRLDPVSQKELSRNEAVYRLQNNRNPFIDHPELAEHIWGDSKTVGWTGSASVATLDAPAEGSTVDLGVTMAGMSRQMAVTVRGTGLTQAVSLATSDAAFTVSPTSLTAAAANAGTAVTVTYRPTAEGEDWATLTLTSGALTRTVDLTGSCVDHIPALAAANVGETAFTARWSDVIRQAGAMLSLTVTEAATDTPVDGYDGRAVAAADESCRVEGLEPATLYTYRLTYGSMASNTVSVTTAKPSPSVVLATAGGDNELTLTARPGETSAPQPLFIELENVDAGQTVTIGTAHPFQLSQDMHDWSESIEFDPDNDHFYVRLDATDLANGESVTKSVTVVVGNWADDNFMLTGQVSLAALHFGSNAGQGAFDAWSPSRGVLAVQGPADVLVYGVDGIVRFEGRVGGYSSLGVAPGLYLVSDRDSGALRRVAVR